MLEDKKLRFRLKRTEDHASPIHSSDGQWHHVVTCVGSGGQQLYLDGELIGTGEIGAANDE